MSVGVTIDVNIELFGAIFRMLLLWKILRFVVFCKTMENLTKRERSTNFNNIEINLLMELVAKHRTTIENKQTDAVTNREKEAAWNKISAQFNASTGFTARNSKSIKLKYESIKKDAKKKMAKHRQELYRTGGGPSSAPDLTDIDEKVMAICSNISGLDARNDSDSIPEPKLMKTNKVMPLQMSDTNIDIFSCDDIPITSDQDNFCSTQHNILDKTENDKDDFNTHQSVEQTQNVNNWSSWNPKALKKKISPGLKQKITKAGVTAKLDQLSAARLELVQLQMEIAKKEHSFVEEEHNRKMLSLQNDEIRKEQLHQLMLSTMQHNIVTKQS